MEAAETIEVIVEPDVAEYRRILRERAKETIKNNRLALGVELTVIVIWLFSTFVISDFDGPIHRAILLALSIVFVLHLLVYAAIIYGISSQAKKWTGMGDPITYRFGQKGLKSSSKTVTWESPWARFPKVVETDSDLLFILANDDFVPIPKRFIPNQAVLAQLRRVIADNASGSLELQG